MKCYRMDYMNPMWWQRNDNREDSAFDSAPTKRQKCDLRWCVSVYWRDAACLNSMHRNGKLQDILMFHESITSSTKTLRHHSEWAQISNKSILKSLIDPIHHSPRSQYHPQGLSIYHWIAFTCKCALFDSDTICHKYQYLKYHHGISIHSWGILQIVHTYIHT